MDAHTEIQSQKPIVTAALRLMRPIVAMLLDSGVTWKEFAELSKSTYVEVALEGYGIRGRPTNVSRTAILTGLTRREVMRQRDKLAAAALVVCGSSSHAARVLSAWHQAPAFLDAQGQPLELPLAGHGTSLETLMRGYGGDVPHGALLKALRHAGAVEETPRGTFRATKRYYMPKALNAEAVLRAGSVLHDLGATVHHNLSRGEGSRTRFEGRAANDRMSRDWVKAFHGLVETRGQAFLEMIDDWLAAHQSSEEPVGAELTRLGVGVYLIEDE